MELSWTLSLTQLSCSLSRKEVIDKGSETPHCLSKTLRVTLGMLQVCGNFIFIITCVVPRVGGAFAMLAFGSRSAAVRKGEGRV